MIILPTNENSPFPALLVEAIANGDAVLCLGTGTRRQALAAALAATSDNPAGLTSRSLPEVARYLEATQDRHYLMRQVRDWVEAHETGPTELHQAIARLPLRYLVDLSYGDQLAQALQQAKQNVRQVVEDVALSYQGKEPARLLKPYGVITRLDETLLLTEQQIAWRHLGIGHNFARMIVALQEWAAGRPWLWVDIDPTDATWQDFRRAVTHHIAPRHRHEFALTTSEQAAVWEAYGVTLLSAADPVAWLRALGDAAAALPSPPSAAPTIPVNRRPFKFLDYYTEEDADLFFGRESGIARLVGMIRAAPLVTLVGQSGVGKTSLLRAGVLPKLAQDAYWPIYARPGQDPVEAIRAAVLQDKAVSGWRVGERTELAHITDLGVLLAVMGERLGKTPLVVLDQSEECFTVVAPEIRKRWVQTVAQIRQDNPSGVRWVLSLREDFLADLHNWSAQIPGLFAYQMRLTPLSQDEAQEAITQPLQRVGVTIEERLVAQLLPDLAEVRAPDSIPPAQLQIVCDRLYQARTAGSLITLADYETLGAARRILADYVDEALRTLPHARRELAVALLKQMVTGRETKLPLPPQEIMAGVAGEMAEKEAVLAGLVGARLVRGLDVNGAPRYELAHDILVEKVKSWIDEIERQAHTARDFLRQGREEWARLEILPQPEKIAYLHQQRENPYLHLDEADLRLMLHAALRQGTAPDYWTRRAAGAGLEVAAPLTEALRSDRETARIYALYACLGAPPPLALVNLGAGMVDESPRVRAAAHQLLFDLDTPEALALLDGSDDLRLVPAGEFTMGEGNQAHPVFLEAYFIEKYPVTNEKYAQFIAAGGYQTETHWTRQGWRWRRRNGRTQPAEWEKRKNRTDHPVVYVTWHEAWAYAAWAGRRLPTEAEWEKAATWRDGEKLAYPWSDEFDKARCNTSESKIGTTTPIGRYSPAGDSPYGCVDMSGNVWEWTSSLYQPYPYRADDGREDAEAAGGHVQRGGSYIQGASYALGAFRRHINRIDFDDGDGYGGFRCGVVSRPFSPPPADR